MFEQLSYCGPNKTKTAADEHSRSHSPQRADRNTQDTHQDCTETENARHNQTQATVRLGTSRIFTETQAYHHPHQRQNCSLWFFLRARPGQQSLNIPQVSTSFQAHVFMLFFAIHHSLPHVYSPLKISTTFHQTCPPTCFS